MGRNALCARSAAGRILRARSSALSVQGVRWGAHSMSTVVSADAARSAVGLKSASTVVNGLTAKCGGLGIHEHGRIRSTCKECGGGSFCEHVVVRSAVSGIREPVQRIAVAAQSASTVVGAIRARSAAGLKSASTVVSASSARSAVGPVCERSHQSARSAVVHQSASTVVGALRARSVAPRKWNAMKVVIFSRALPTLS